MAKKKVGFASGIGFILAAAGSAVGLGNLWGFPYKTAKNGGAAFVFVYIACVLLIGFVTMLSEIHIGKRAHSNPISSYKQVSKGMGWVGLLSIAIPFIITCYYSVLGGYTIKYSMNSFSGNSGALGTFSVNVGEVILYTGLFILLAIIVIMGGVKEGIEKMSKILMPTLFVILIGVVIYSLCLGDGVKEGLDFYLNPRFDELTWSSVLAAMGQAFFSLSIGMGAMITYGSYTGREVNIVKSTGLICLCDTLVALLAGLAIFPAVAHFDASKLESSKGIGLIFSILPEVFDDMGIVGSIISFLFFAMVAIAALTSVISLIEVVTQFVIQKFHAPRRRSALIVALIAFAISIPIGISLGKVGIREEEGLNLFGYDMLTFCDEVTNTILMPVTALFACIAIGWIIKPKKAIKEIEENGDKSEVNKVVGAIYSVMVKFITPALILIVEVFGIINTILPTNADGVREFNKAGLSLVIVAYAILLVCVAVYLICFRNKETGTNDDEIIADELEREKQYNQD